MASRARTRRPTGDDATNARKRYYRAAERYLKQAEKASGATAARYQELARQNFTDAMNTYSKSTTQDFSRPIQKLANILGIDLAQVRQNIKTRTDEAAEKIRGAAIKLGKGSKSFKALQTTKAERAEQLRQDEARAVFNSSIGKRIMGGTVELWKEDATVEVMGKYGKELKVDQTKIYPILFDYFKVDNLADLLEKVEDITGEVLYAHGTKDEFYEVAKLTLQNRIAADNSVTA